MGEAKLIANFNWKHPAATFNKQGYIEKISVNLPFPALSFQTSGDRGDQHYNIKVGNIIGKSLKGLVTISRAQLEAHPIANNFELQVSGKVKQLVITFHMQFSRRLYGSENPKKLSYRDDSGDCIRRLTFSSDLFPKKRLIRNGHTNCQSNYFDFTRSYSYPLSTDKGWARIKQTNGCYRDKWGIYNREGKTCEVEFEFPYFPGNHGRLKVSDYWDFSWAIWQDGQWTSLPVKRLGRYSWVELGKLQGYDQTINVKAFSKTPIEGNPRTLIDFVGYEQGPETLRPLFLDVQ